MDVNVLIDSIVNKRKHELSKKISRYPRNNMILSDISECDRQMVYGVLNWQERAMFNEEVQARLNEGNEQERKVVSELLGMGFKVILAQQPVEIKGIGGVMLARGRIDGFIEIDRATRFPFEIKSMNPNIFNAIKTLDDMSKKPYQRKYIRQLQMYMFGNNVEQGLFILTDCLGHWKLLPVYLDLGECEAILQRLERAYKGIQSKTYPNRIPYDSSICDMCPFSLTCLQDVLNKPAELIDNKEFETTIDRMLELKPISKEYGELYDKIKTTTKGIEKIIVGGKYLIQQVPSQRTEYKIPDDIKKQYAKKVPTARMVIQDLTKDKK